jgi:hypothetical protein
MSAANVPHLAFPRKEQSLSSVEKQKSFAASRPRLQFTFCEQRSRMNYIPSPVLLLLCVCLMYVFVVGFLCCAFDVSSWAVRKLEAETAPLSVETKSDKIFSTNQINTMRCLAILLLCAAPAFHAGYFRPMTILGPLLAIGAVYILAKGAHCVWLDFVIWFKRLGK